MLLTNTSLVGGGNGLNSNLSGARRRTLAGLGDVLVGDYAGNSGFEWSNFQSWVPAVNAELLYLINLNRINKGLPPINAANAAPTVNVGISPDTKNMLLLGGAALLLVVLLANRKKK